MRGFITFYFWGILVFFGLGWLLVLAAAGSASEPWQPSLSDVALTLITIVSLVGIGAFVFRRPLGNVGFWKVWFGIQAASTLYVFIFRILLDVPGRIEGAVEVGMTEGGAILAAVLITSLGVLLLVPMVIGLYLYAFGSPEIWDVQSRSPETVS